MKNVLYFLKSDGSPDKIWTVPCSRGLFAEIDDKWWSATFGDAQNKLNDINSEKHVELDFSGIEWIDPLPLLGILVAIKDFCSRTSSSLVIQLGSSTGGARRGGFLKFLLEHGFIDSLSGLGKNKVKVFLSTEGKVLQESIGQENSEIRKKIAQEFHSMTYSDSRCLNIKLIDICERIEIDEKINYWLDEIRNYGLLQYEHDTEYLDDILYRIRIILTEVLLNGIEHAYDKKQLSGSKYIAIYARIRREAIQDREDYSIDEEHLTDAIKKEASRCPRMSEFPRNCKFPWIEIFYCDNGRGLCADLETWKENAAEELRKKLQRVKASTNILNSICHYLFHEAISRHDRKGRTVLTGLQHIKLILENSQDFARVYSHGEWKGAVFPWNENRVGSSLNLGKQDEYKHYNQNYGTAWHYCIQLKEQPSGGLSCGDRINATDIESPHKTEVEPKISEWKIFDERDLGSGINYCKWENANLANEKLQFIWLPGMPTKHRIYQWLSALKNVSGTGKSHIWIIADLPNRQAQALIDILKSEANAHSCKHSKFYIFIITSDWNIASFQNNNNIIITKPDSYCRKIAKKRGQYIFKLLRAYDSELFWDAVESSSSTHTMESPFIHETIIWKRDDKNSPQVFLEGYLDLTHALSNIKCRYIARQALKRLWHLFAQDAECEESDVLLTNLLPPEARRKLPVSTDSNDNPRKVIVSSILVTGSTINMFADKGQDVIHLLRHSRIIGRIQDTYRKTDRFALNWGSGDKWRTISTQSEKPQYERIPGTPYIGRGGQKSIPVRRYYYLEDKSRRSIYEEDPNQMYNSFSRLNILKLGHWVYGEHHDLITLNLERAVRLDSLDKGPIFRWLREELNPAKNGYNIVIYPSHSVTEKLIETIKKKIDTNELPNYFIPVHFLRKHTQTSIRIPSLTYDRIKSLCRNQTVILLDDATRTGKVHRELEQLILNAGAKKVIQIGIVNRTGLPLYRNYLTSEEYKETHHFYWRWDVPALGSARTCPLCRAIAQTKESKIMLRSNTVIKIIDKWISAWSAESVTTNWGRGGLEPADLPVKPRLLTFGKEWDETTGEELMRDKINHKTTTGLASSIIELIRTTSYRGVGIKLAENPWPEEDLTERNEPSWRRARLEILISQTLLFFDDFDQDELIIRFELILRILGAPYRDNNNPAIAYLACLTLMLLTKEQAHDVVRKIAPRLHTLIGEEYSENFNTSLSILIHRSGMTNKDIINHAIKVLPLNDDLLANFSERLQSMLNFVRTLTVGHEPTETISGLKVLIMLLGDSKSSLHTGSIQKSITGAAAGGRDRVTSELSRAIEAFEMIDQTIINSTPFVKKIEDLRDEIKVAAKINNIMFAQKLEYISEEFQAIFFTPIADVERKLNEMITPDLWRDALKSRKDDIKEKWKNGDILPKIRIDITRLNSDKKSIIVCPSVGWNMIRDEMFNVMHLSAAYETAEDMRCDLSIDGNVLRIEMRNLATEKWKTADPKYKYNEKIYINNIFPGAAIKRYLNAYNSDHEMVVEINLPFVQQLFQEGCGN